MSRGREILSDEGDAFPKVFGAYLLLTALGKGGMGEVFLAKRRFDDGTQEICVVKKLRNDLVKDREYVTRFVDEALVVVNLDHAHICRVFDVGKTADGEYFLAMEYLSGVDAKALTDRAAKRGGGVPAAAAIQIAIDVVGALDYAHKAKHPRTREPLELIHRDVSPHNVIVGFDGRSKLIDFGLASSRLKIEQTAPNVVMGKMAYMGPEQARGDPIDARADQFAIAMVLYELLAGERFYEGLTPNEIWHTVGKGGFRPRRWKELDRGLRSILDKALHKDAKKRFADCDELRRSLVQYLHGHFSDDGQGAVSSAMADLAGDEMEAEWERLAGFAEVSLSGFTKELEVTGRMAQVIAQASPGARSLRPPPPRPARPSDPTAVVSAARVAGSPLDESTELVDRARRGKTEIVRDRQRAPDPTEVVRDRSGGRGDPGVVVVHPSQAQAAGQGPSKALVVAVGSLTALLLLALGALLATVLLDDGPEEVAAHGDPQPTSSQGATGLPQGPPGEGDAPALDDEGLDDEPPDEELPLDEEQADEQTVDEEPADEQRVDKQQAQKAAAAHRAQERQRAEAEARRAARRKAERRASTTRTTRRPEPKRDAEEVDEASETARALEKARKEAAKLIAQGKAHLRRKGYRRASSWPDTVREAFQEAQASPTSEAKAGAFEFLARKAPKPRAKSRPKKRPTSLPARIRALKVCFDKLPCAKRLIGQLPRIKDQGLSAIKRRQLEREIEACEKACR